MNAFRFLLRFLLFFIALGFILGMLGWLGVFELVAVAIAAFVLAFAATRARAPQRLRSN